MEFPDLYQCTLGITKLKLGLLENGKEIHKGSFDWKFNLNSHLSSNQIGIPHRRSFYKIQGWQYYF